MVVGSNPVGATLAQVFPYGFCKIFKNTIFMKQLRATASAFGTVVGI